MYATPTPFARSNISSSHFSAPAKIKNGGQKFPEAEIASTTEMCSLVPLYTARGCEP